MRRISRPIIPDYLNSIGRGDLIGPALTALKVGQLPDSLLLLVLASCIGRRSYFLFGGLTLLGVLGFILGSGAVIVGAAAGFGSAAVLILILALPPLLARQEDTSSMAAGIFTTISYSCALMVPIISGLAWDLSGLPSRPSARSAANTAHPASAFIPVALGAVTMTCLAPTLGVSRKRVPG